MNTILFSYQQVEFPWEDASTYPEDEDVSSYEVRDLAQGLKGISDVGEEFPVAHSLLLPGITCTPNNSHTSKYFYLKTGPQMPFTIRS